MKRTVKAGFAKSISALLIAGVVMLTGCVRDDSDAAVFKLVASQLDTGGTVYSILSSRHIFSEFDQELAKFDRDVYSGRLTSQDKLILRRKAALLKMLVDLSGIRNIRGIGASSAKLPDGTFRNRIFVAMPENSPGLLNEILSKKLSPMPEVIGDLPDTVQVVISANISLKSLFQALVASGDFGRQFVPGLKLPPQIDLSVLNDIESWAMIAMAQKPGHAPEDDCMMISIPDEKGRLFDMFVEVMGLQRFADKKSRRVAFPVSAGVSRPVICWKDRKLVFYNHSKAEALFTPAADVPRLKDSADFIRYSAMLPKKGCAFIFFRDCDTVMGIKEMPRCCVVVTRKPEGILWEDNSEDDISSEFSSLFFQNWREKVLKSALDAPSRKPGIVPRKSKRTAVKQVDCRKEMVQIYRALKTYSGKNHRGEFPAEAGAAGWKKIRSVVKTALPPESRYYYLGYEKKFAAEKNIPLLLERASSRRDHFCVMYLDGTIREFKLVNPGSCRRMISFLFTVHRWNMDVFQHLIRQAEILDGQPLKSRSE